MHWGPEEERDFQSCLREDAAPHIFENKTNSERRKQKSNPQIKSATMNVSFAQRKSHPIIGPNLREKGGGGEVGRRELLTAAAQWN